MPPVAYTVIASFRDHGTASEFVAWLRGGHIQAVIRAGAASGAIIQVTDPATPVQVEARYVFASRQALDRYIATAAPALRAEGLKVFGPERGVTFERRIGTLEWSAPVEGVR